MLLGYTTHSAGQMLNEADYKTEVSNLHTNMLVLDHTVKASNELGIPSEWMTPLQNNYHQLVKGGYGTDSPERIFEIISHQQ
ncbi:hypothetical protein [Gracilibacillus sp. HCP3S3_G5_2]|uniref:imine reductase family protein n=1 Tax=Gracilibacillus sp. HCP3S3_G5_2 TaxID=3438941 RepID=UPI003F893104